MVGRAAKPQAAAEVNTITDANLRRFAGYNMKRAFIAVQADLGRALEPFDLRMITYSALALIVENPGLRQAQLAEGLSIERSNLVAIVDGLEKSGWIVRNPMPNDRRAYALTATEAGAALFERATAAVTEHEEKCLRDLGAEDRKQMTQMLKLVERASHSA